MGLQQHAAHTVAGYRQRLIYRAVVQRDCAMYTSQMPDHVSALAHRAAARGLLGNLSQIGRHAGKAVSVGVSAKDREASLSHGEGEVDGLDSSSG